MIGHLGKAGPRIGRNYIIRSMIKKYRISKWLIGLIKDYRVQLESKNQKVKPEALKNYLENDTSNFEDYGPPAVTNKTNKTNKLHRRVKGAANRSTSNNTSRVSSSKSKGILI